MDYPQNEYNVIIALGVLDCILYKEDIIKVIRNLRLSLKSEGYLFVNMYSKNNDELSSEKYDLSKEMYGEAGIILGNSGIMFHHYGDEDILLLFSDFVVLQYEHKKFWSFNQKKQVNGLSLVLHDFRLNRKCDPVKLDKVYIVSKTYL
ncbi:MAG: hypothetical protein Q8O06_08425 [Acetobacterium sp.]|nr:hypothetical protein [Acetobacterium sp.]